MDRRLPRLLPGSLFAERFRIVEIIGQGSMGSVYKVDDNGRTLALKVLNVAALGETKAARRFEREVRTGAGIQSEHVTRTLDAGTDATTDLVWLAMEYIQGGDLEKHVQERAPLAADEVRSIAEQLFAALIAFHEAGVVHRDLKPQNVAVEMRAGAPFVKVLDFGIAKSFKSNDISTTQAGLGTPLWTAPEQNNQGYVPDPTSDVWALGLIMFFVLTGKQYWLHANDSSAIAELLMEVLRSPIQKASERAQALGVGERVPLAFDAWFARTVNRDPRQRFRDAAEAYAALDDALPRVASRSRSLALVFFAFLGVLFAALGLYVWLK